MDFVILAFLSLIKSLPYVSHLNKFLSKIILSREKTIYVYKQKLETAEIKNYTVLELRINVVYNQEDRKL